MNPRQAWEQGREILNELGLGGWALGFDRAKRRAGACHYARQMITLSEHFVSMNDWDEVRITILHEAAHALTPNDRGHGWEWKAKCRELGIAPERCYGEDVAMPEGSIRIMCPNHGQIGTRHRMPKRGLVYRCKRCKEPVKHLRAYQ